MYDHQTEVIAEADALTSRAGLPTYSELAKALRDLTPMFEDYQRGGLVEDAEALLASIPNA